MLFLHCGLRRTGTSSLQAVLAREKDPLEAAGIEYPEKWRPAGSNAHYGLAEMLEPSAGRDAAVAGFREYLAAGKGETVLLSSESLATWLSDEKRPALLSLLRAAQAERSIGCIWTLRAADELIGSMYLHQVMFGYEIASAEDYFLQSARRAGSGMGAMLELERALGVEFTYLRYGGNGEHNAEILRGVGVPEALRDRLVGEIRSMPRLNPSLSRKAAAAVLHRDAISARVGEEIAHSQLKELFYGNGFQFEADGPCVLVSGEVRRKVHESTLEAAYEHGFTPYVEFFERREVEADAPSRTDADVLTERDVEQLVRRLDGRA